MSKPQRNSPERAEAMIRRGAEQYQRTAGYTSWRSKRGGVEAWEKVPRRTLMSGVPAWMNRRTGKPHEHNRQRARRMRVAHG